MNINKNKKQFHGSDNLFKKEIDNYIDSFTLSDNEKQQLFYKIKNNNRQKKHITIKKTFGTAFAVFACVLLAAIAANASISQKAATFIKEFFGTRHESLQIIDNISPQIDIYAPVLLSCDENYIIFANNSGLLIYDRIEKETAATIDLQEIECNYFNAESLSTKFIIKDGIIKIFNLKNEKVYGDCYIYNFKNKLKPNKISCLEPTEITKAESSLLNEWEEEMKPYYLKTWEQIDSYTMMTWSKNIGKLNSAKYSEQSILWTSKEQNTYVSCLLVSDNNTYQLYTINKSTGNIDIENLQIKTSKKDIGQNKSENTLPQFVYSGDDILMKTVCDYMVQNESYKYYGTDDGFPFIPAPVFFDITQEDDITKIYGKFWGHVYCRIGNTFESMSGSSMAACFHLKEENGTYTVIKVDIALDGGDYMNSIKEFCDYNPDLYNKFFDNDNTELQEKAVQIRKELLEQYIIDNNLDIKYYHDYGFDPVELFTDNTD